MHFEGASSPKGWKYTRPFSALLKNGEHIDSFRKRVRTLLAQNAGEAAGSPESIELLGQCTQNLKDKMKHNQRWSDVSDSNDPLQLIGLIEMMVLAQTHDQYPYAAVYDQEFALYPTLEPSLVRAV